MAGGSGTRFWPLSREKFPKQVLKVVGAQSLIQETVARLDGLVAPERIVVVTNRTQRRLISSQLPGLNAHNFVLEPSARNTAACIGLAAIHIRRIDPDAVMVVLPSDHLVRDNRMFHQAVETAIDVARNFDGLVTFGIPPSRPETGYGYIQIERSGDGLPEMVHRVRAFAEKPNVETARRFVSSGDFYWNSGIFVWHVARILSEMEEHLPEQYHQLEAIDRAWGSPSYPRTLLSRWARIKPISIDYGVMEVASAPIFMVEGDFGWSDVGSWDELYRINDANHQGNVEMGESVLLDAESNLIYSPDRLTAVIGLKDILVVNTPQATLICPLSRAQDVKQLVERLKREGREKYL